MSSVGTGPSTNQPYDIFQVSVGAGSGKEPVESELHAYKEADWAKVGLLTRCMARICGRVTDKVIDGKVYVVVNSLYGTGDHKRTANVSSDFISKALDSLFPKRSEQPGTATVPQELPQATGGNQSISDQLKNRELGSTLSESVKSFQVFFLGNKEHTITPDEAKIMLNRIASQGSVTGGTMTTKGAEGVLQAMITSDKNPDIEAQRYFLKLMDIAGIPRPKAYRGVDY